MYNTPMDKDKKTNPAGSGVNLNEALKKLETIASWFDARREVDVEEGLKKVKEGAGLIGDVKKRLREIENEFEEVKKGLNGEDSTS